MAEKQTLSDASTSPTVIHRNFMSYHIVHAYSNCQWIAAKRCRAIGYVHSKQAIDMGYVEELRQTWPVGSTYNTHHSRAVCRLHKPDRIEMQPLDKLAAIATLNRCKSDSIPGRDSLRSWTVRGRRDARGRSVHILRLRTRRVWWSIPRSAAAGSGFWPHEVSLNIGRDNVFSSCKQTAASVAAKNSKYWDDASLMCRLQILIQPCTCSGLQICPSKRQNVTACPRPAAGW